MPRKIKKQLPKKLETFHNNMVQQTLADYDNGSVWNKILLLTKNTLFCFDFSFENDHQKERVIEAATKTASIVPKLIGATNIAAMWYAPAKDAYSRASEHPDRKDGLIIVSQDLSRNIYTNMYMIEDGKPIEYNLEEDERYECYLLDRVLNIDNNLSTMTVEAAMV